MDMKLVGLVFLGLIASAVFYFPLGLLIGVIFPNIGWGMLFACFFAVMPLAFLLGSIVTGYFSYYDIEDKWLLIWMAPALYLNVLWISVAAVRFSLDAFIGVNPPGPGFLRDLLISVAIGLLWYIASAAGVFLGYFLRGKFAKWWYGD